MEGHAACNVKEDQNALNTGTFKHVRKMEFSQKLCLHPESWSRMRSTSDLRQGTWASAGIAYLQDQMNNKIGAIYPILLDSQYSIWTINPFKSHLVLKVQLVSTKAWMLGLLWQVHLVSLRTPVLSPITRNGWPTYEIPRASENTEHLEFGASPDFGCPKRLA